ncbi:MAG: nucleotidyltransferase domain-containing protein [Candidatus Heimdallarchaeota archaeon]
MSINSSLYSLEELNKNASALAERNDIYLIYLFGSRLTPMETAFRSDYDFGVLLTPKQATSAKSPFSRGFLVGQFELELNIAPVDIVILNSAPPILAFEIIKNGKLFYCKDEEIRISFEVSAIRNYLDYKFYNDRFNEEYLDSLRMNGVYT